MEGNITDASYFMQFRPDDQITGYLKKIAQEAAKGITLEIDSDVSDVLKDIDKIAKALNDAMAQSGTFDFNKLFDLKTSLAKLGELSKTVGNIDEIFGSLHNTTDALTKSITQIASLKLDAGQFKGIKDSLDSIDTTLTSLSNKFANIDDVSGLDKLKNQADAAGESIKKTTQEQEKLNQAQANQPAKKQNVKEWSDDKLERNLKLLEQEKQRRQDLATTVQNTQGQIDKAVKHTSQSISDQTEKVIADITTEQRAIEDASNKIAECQSRIDKINFNKNLTNIYSDNIKNQNYGVDLSKITKVEAMLKTVTAEIATAETELTSAADLYAKQGIQDNINYLKRVQLDLQNIVDTKKNGSFDKKAYDTEVQELHRMHELSEQFYADEIKQAQAVIKYNEELITKKKQVIEASTGGTKSAEQAQAQKELAQVAQQAGEAQVSAQNKVLENADALEKKIKSLISLWKKVKIDTSKVDMSNPNVYKMEGYEVAKSDLNKAGLPTQASVKRVLDSYLQAPSEESKLKLMAYVEALNDATKAAKIFGTKNAEVYKEIQASIETMNSSLKAYNQFDKKISTSLPVSLGTGDKFDAVQGAIQKGDLAGAMQLLTEYCGKLQETEAAERSVSEAARERRQAQQQTTSSTPAQPMQQTAEAASAAAGNVERLEQQLAEATVRSEALEQQMAEVNARAQQTVTGKVDIGNTVAITGDGGQLALEKTLKATYHIQQNMVKIMAEINSKMVSGAETATISYEQLSAAVTSVVTAMEKLSTTTFAPTGVIDATNDRIVELEANLTKATQRIKELESNSKKSTKTSVASTTAAVVQKTQEQLDLENKVAEVTKFSAEARIRIQENLQKQILETTALISTEYDKIREMYQYINDFAYQSNGKKNAFNNAMNAKRNLVDFNKSGSNDAVQRAQLEYAYQKSYQELLNKIGTSQSNSNRRMLSQLGNVKTSASLEENLAIIEREIKATAQLIEQQRALNAARQGRIDSHGSVLEELHNIEILAKQYDNYIAKQKTVDKLKQKIAAAKESGASEQQLISLNKQLDYANEKLQKADTFMQKAFANNPVGEAIVKMRTLADETERVSKASSSTKTTTSATTTTKDPLKEYQAAHKKIFGSASLGRLIDPKNNQEIVTLLDQVRKLDNIINTTGGDIKNINDATQVELKETAEQLAKLQNTANGEAIKKGALNAYNVGRGDYAGAFKALSEEQGLMFKNAQGNSRKYAAALTSAAQSIAGFKLETAELDSSQKKLVATYRDQNQNLQQLTVSYQELGNGARYVQKMIEPHKNIVKDALTPITKKMKELMTYFSSFMVIMRVINFVKEGVNTIRELNTAFTELKVVTGESNDAIERFEKSAQKVARSIASTTLEVTQSATEWARLGYTMAESLELAEQAAIYSKVGFTDIGVATENLTSTLQAFYADDIKKGIISAGDAAAEITDKLVFVGNKFASSAEGMGQGITAAGAALVAANNTLDESLAMITAGIVCLNYMETCYYRTHLIALSA